VFVQLRLRDRAPLDRLQRARAPLRVELAGPQEARPYADGAERGAQLVRQHGQEPVLHLVRLAQLARTLLHGPLEGGSLLVELAAEIPRLDRTRQRSDEVITVYGLRDEVVRPAAQGLHDEVVLPVARDEQRRRVRAEGS